MVTHDDLGADVPLAGPARRIVSLVPSLTEAIAATARGRLVGATDWCTHPADLEEMGVTRVRGTKNPDRPAIEALRPDLVVANQEENRELEFDLVSRTQQSGALRYREGRPLDLTLEQLWEQERVYRVVEAPQIGGRARSFGRDRFSLRRIGD